MNKLVTLEQEKKLRKLGYDKVHCTCGGFPDCICTIENSIITISEALEWFREVKGIECEVCLRLCFMGDTGDATFGGYEYIIFDHNTNKTISSDKYYDRKVAESALLDEVMKYISI